MFRFSSRGRETAPETETERPREQKRNRTKQIGTKFLPHPADEAQCSVPWLAKSTLLAPDPHPAFGAASPQGNELEVKSGGAPVTLSLIVLCISSASDASARRCLVEALAPKFAFGQAFAVQCVLVCDMPRTHQHQLAMYLGVPQFCAFSVEPEITRTAERGPETKRKHESQLYVS